MDTITRLKTEAFFRFRHWECPWPLVQQEVIRVWEPYVATDLEKLSVEEYAKLRKPMNIDAMVASGIEIIRQYRNIFDRNKEN